MASPEPAAKLQAPPPLWPYVAVIGMFCVLVLVREPQIILRGRIWAEDGTYLAAAFHRSFLAMLAFVGPAVGYRLLFLNLTAFAASHWVPLEYSPYVFVGLELLLQTLPLVLLLLARAELRLTLLWFGVAALCCLLTQPNSEVWLTTIGSGFILSASAAIILISTTTTLPRRWLARAVLAVGATTGLPTLFLTPLFAYRALKERDRERIIQTGILVLLGTFQAWSLLNHGTGIRQYVFSTDAIAAAILTNQILLPLVGHDLLLNVESVVGALRQQIIVNRMTGLSYLALLGSVGLFGAALYGLARQSRRSECGLLLSSAMVVSVASIVGSLAGMEVISLGTHGRYFYVPNLLILLAAVIALAPGGSLPRIQWYVAVVPLVWVLGVGCWEYFLYPPYFYSGPPWSEEVANWRRWPYTPLRISPWAGWGGPASWSISLSDTVATPELLSHGENLLSVVSISEGKRLAERFQPDVDTLIEITVRSVTWARRPGVHDYPINWDLYEVLPTGKALRAKGVLQARDAGNWTTMSIDLPKPLPGSGSWYELGFRSPGNIPPDRSIGFPLYALAPEDTHVQTPTVDEVPWRGQGVALKLGLCCTFVPPLPRAK